MLQFNENNIYLGGSFSFLYESASEEELGYLLVTIWYSYNLWVSSLLQFNVLFNLEDHYFSLSSESAFEGELGYLQVTIWHSYNLWVSSLLQIV